MVSFLNNLLLCFMAQVKWRGTLPNDIYCGATQRKSHLENQLLVCKEKAEKIFLFHGSLNKAYTAPPPSHPSIDDNLDCNSF